MPSPNPVFTNRFTQYNPTLGALVGTDEFYRTPDDTLKAICPELAQMAVWVREYSVFLNNTSLVEIYDAITNSDRRIAIRLAAKRDKADQRILPTEEDIKAVMFGITSQDTFTFYNSDLNQLVDGIARISCALAAHILIGKLSQIKEQFTHAKHIEAQAIQELDLLFESINVAAVLEATTNLPASNSQSLYFEDKHIDLITGESLALYVYLSSTSTPAWQLVTTYSGVGVSTIEFCVALVDFINAQTLETLSGSTLAVLRPNVTQAIHEIQFQARYRDLVVVTEVVSIRFTFTTDDVLPFKWGANLQYLHSKLYGSLFIAIQKGTVQVIPTPSDAAASCDKDITVVYFRRLKPGDDGLLRDGNGLIVPNAVWQQDSQLRYRVSPTDNEITVLPVPYYTNSDLVTQEALDRERPCQVALLLLNSLNERQESTRMLGALFRNDNPPLASDTTLSPELNNTLLSGVELIAFSVTNPEVYLVLDILEVPPDIEIAIGSLCSPHVLFSNKPKSARVGTHYDFKFDSTTTTTASILDSRANPLITGKESKLLANIKTAVNLQTGYYNRMASLNAAISSRELYDRDFLTNPDH